MMKLIYSGIAATLVVLSIVECGLIAEEPDFSGHSRADSSLVGVDNWSGSRFLCGNELNQALCDLCGATGCTKAMQKQKRDITAGALKQKEEANSFLKPKINPDSVHYSWYIQNTYIVHECCDEGCWSEEVFEKCI